MEYDKTKEPASQESLNVSKITELLMNLSVRIDSLERSLANINGIANNFPAVMAITTDTADEFYRNAAASGIDIEERLKKVSNLIIMLTDPKKIDTFSQSINTIDTVMPLLKQFERMPDTLAVIVDSFDELCKNKEQSGIDF